MIVDIGCVSFAFNASFSSDNLALYSSTGRWAKLDSNHNNYRGAGDQ